jgi:hypothetical protein
MTTITFKVTNADARRLRQRARAAKTSLSELLRQRVLEKKTGRGKIKLRRCPLTGADIFAPQAEIPAFTTDTVRDMLAEFP